LISFLFDNLMCWSCGANKWPCWLYYHLCRYFINVLDILHNFGSF